MLERLLVDRARFGADTRIVHLFRTYVEGRHGRNMWLKRKGEHGFAYQVSARENVARRAAVDIDAGD